MEKQEKIYNESKKNIINKNRGVTLIALVITIIVLLILAGVSIATLTGENGVLTQAENAGTQTEIAEVIEKAKLDILAWQTEKESNNEDATLTDSVIQEILTGKVYVEGEPGSKSFVSTNGHTILYADLYEEPMTIEEAKGLENGFDKNTTLVDEFGNTVKVPEGFKIASDSATSVTGGVVIEDVDYGETAGSQFVWIPVGKVYTNEEQTDYETINLSRYTFDSLGNSTAVGSNPIASGEYNWQELSEPTSGNTIAKSITTFISKVNSSHGYYIGRYEARTNTTGPRNASTDEDGLTQITVKANDFVYNYVTQLQAAKLSQEMYTEKTFTSDLLNSYAWDTAIVFIQAFDDREGSNKEYSMQASLNLDSDIGLAEKGTNNEELRYQDKVCNIWDMASNCYEYTTETYSLLNYHCTNRGGSCINSADYTSFRGYYRNIDNFPKITFRPILYL